MSMQDQHANSPSSFSPSLPPNSPLQGSSSNQTSSTSLEHPPLSPSSIIGPTPTPTSQALRRSDSWWARLSHTSFLDRRVNDASRRSSGMLDIRDPNPRPRLIAIEEITHSTSPDNEEQYSRLPLGIRGQSLSRKPSGANGIHNKSLTSLGTADTEMIEKMAQAVDAIQMFRTASTRRTTDSPTSSVDSLPIDVRSNLLSEERDISAAGDEETLPFISSPVEMSYTEAFVRGSQYSPPPSSPLPSPKSSAKSVVSSHLPRAGEGAGAVVSRIREYERRMSLDQEVPSPTNTRQREERLRKKGAVNYGLVQRPSLFIANPDGRATRPED
jgi:hypothetical protein